MFANVEVSLVCRLVIFRVHAVDSLCGLGNLPTTLLSYSSAIILTRRHRIVQSESDSDRKVCMTQVGVFSYFD